MDQRNQHKPLTLYTFGDSILDCDHDGLTPGRLLVRNDDQVFPEFRGLDLASRGPVRLEQRASGGTTIETLHEQAHGLKPTGKGLGIVTIGGNDLLWGLLVDEGPGRAAFAAALDAFLRSLPLTAVFVGNVYDPTFGDDTLNLTGIDPALARANHQRLNAVIAQVANRYGRMVDLHAHFLRGDPSWCADPIHPSLRGISEIRRCFLPHLLAAWNEVP
jgi:lysophospholipase L1-like esterase